MSQHLLHHLGQLTVNVLISIGLLLGGSASAGQFENPEWTLAGGQRGEAVTLESANPANLSDVIDGSSSPEQPLDALLYLPKGDGPHPVVVFVPGSSGVRPGVDTGHAQQLLELGIGALMLDPYGSRGIEDTIADQVKVSWAASVYDGLAAYRYLATRDDVDAGRVGIIGFSRGGYVAVQAAIRQLADPVLGEGRGFRATYGAYPWCGAQFRRPDVGATRVRIVIGEQDNWVSPIKCQAWAHAMSLINPDISFKLFQQAHHAMDRGGMAVTRLPKAIKSPRFPIWYINDDGAFWDYRDNSYHAGETDAARGQHVMESGLAERGASFGSTPEIAERFSEDMLGFFSSALK